MLNGEFKMIAFKSLLEFWAGVVDDISTARSRMFHILLLLATSDLYEAGLKGNIDLD